MITPICVARSVSVGDMVTLAELAAESVALASPKSRTLTTPAAVTLMLAGLSIFNLGPFSTGLGAFTYPNLTVYPGLIVAPGADISINSAATGAEAAIDPNGAITNFAEAFAYSIAKGESGHFDSGDRLRFGPRVGVLMQSLHFPPPLSVH
jgi:hypothetical protein